MTKPVLTDNGKCSKTNGKREHDFSKKSKEHTNLRFTSRVFFNCTPIEVCPRSLVGNQPEEKGVLRKTSSLGVGTGMSIYPA